MKDKIEQLQCIDNFLYDNLDKNELRALVYDLLDDECLLRSFILYGSMKGAFV